MRILFLCHRFPYPPTFGSKVRAFNTIRHLAQAHEVTVLSLVRSEAEAREAAGIAPHCHAHRAFRVDNGVQFAKIAATLPTPIAASEAFFHSAAMRREVHRVLEMRGADLVFAHCSAVGRYVEHRHRVPVVMDFCDVDSRKWRDYVAHKPWPLAAGYRWEAWRMEAAERRMARRFEQITVATRGEVQALADLGVKDRVDWFPNGVDTAFFSPSDEPWDPDLITFVGRMDYYPNEQCMVDFCDEVLPLLHRARPTLRLQIVGAEPTARVRDLAQREGVVVTGSVPDVRPYVARSALTVSPLKIARGVQNKILESMAMGVPVVASRIAAAGVDAEVGEHLLAADSPQELRDAILRIVGDRDERNRLGRAGHERVRARHTWASAMRRLDAIIERCVPRPRASGDASLAD